MSAVSLPSRPMYTSVYFLREKMSTVVQPTSYARPEVVAAHPALTAHVLEVVAANCKRGPFTSTAGRVLPCPSEDLDARRSVVC